MTRIGLPSKPRVIDTTVVTADSYSAGQLANLVDEINHAEWDDANEMSTYDVPSLLAYLERQDTLFVVCHETSPAGRTLLGFASSRLEMKPYAREKWLYVDEVDVCSNQRQKGAGSAIMRKLLEFAWQADCEEVWLGTEADNIAANALYKSLDPDDVGSVVGYTYEADD